MVQLPEPCNEKSEAFKAGYKNIAEVGKQRIRRVIEQLEAEQAEKVPRAQGQLLDTAEDATESDREKAGAKHRFFVFLDGEILPDNINDLSENLNAYFCSSV